MIRRPPRSTLSSSSAASDVYKRQYLEDELYELDLHGRVIRVWGSPYQPEFCDWAFNLKPGDATLAKAQEIPSDVDVLVTHGPPHGHGDQTSSRETRVGCPDLMAEIQTRIQPAVHVFGHIHSGYGVTTDGRTSFVNASTCTNAYQPINQPIVFDLGLGEDGEVMPPVFTRFEPVQYDSM
eukprot:TRINITY_DN31030_c0_g1_i1.p1 TRINITY_DN31030_c0_g1~~TRINITY_DN31030_c0_g1_i1.p1  ORF type:complete len:180 (-),score=39.32 TRINITY_DN31030_c0_g1_i1:375-914(-)